MPEHYEPIANPREQFRQAVQTLLVHEGIRIVPDEQETFEEELRGSDRYVRASVEHAEDTGETRRFLKIPVADPEMQKVFARELGVNKFLKEHSELRIETIISSNTEPTAGVPFVLMEALERQTGEIGFDEHGEHLDEQAAQGFAETLQKLHRVNTSELPNDLRDTMEGFPGTYEEIHDELFTILDQPIEHALDRQSATEESLDQVLGRRFGISNFREKVEELLAHLEPTIRSSDNHEVLVHGNLDPGNAFVHQGGEVELIDFEFTGLSKNEIGGSMVNFGNLRARAWRNTAFKSAFDAAMIQSYGAEGREEIGKAITALGILRSHLVLAGFFENYEHEKQQDEEQTIRRETTVQDIRKAWEIVGIPF